jgi:L-fuconolactonase
VRGVVGWVDLAAPDAVAMIESLRADPLLKSVRPMLQDLPDANWILREDVQDTLLQLPSLGVRFDALVKPAQLPAIIEMIERNPTSTSSSTMAPSRISRAMRGSRGRTRCG